MSNPNVILNIISEDNFYYYTRVSCDLLMIFSPSIGYLAQAIKFEKTKSSEGFSKYMCLILLFANLLRIFFLDWKKIYYYSSLSINCCNSFSIIFNSCKFKI